MIKSFRSKALAELWETGSTRHIDRRVHGGVLRRLDRLEIAERVEEMNVAGFDFHRLRGFTPPRHTVHVNSSSCITFEFVEGDAYLVDFEQYH